MSHSVESELVERLRHRGLRDYSSKGRPWSLNHLKKCGGCKDAFLVWLALETLSIQAGNKIITPTRALISALTGINRPSTISKALTALHNARWIYCVSKPIGDYAYGIRCHLKRKTAADISQEPREKPKQLEVTAPAIVVNDYVLIPDACDFVEETSGIPHWRQDVHCTISEDCEMLTMHCRDQSVLDTVTDKLCEHLRFYLIGKYRLSPQFDVEFIVDSTVDTEEKKKAEVMKRWGV